MKPILTCKYLGTMLTNGCCSLAVLFSSDHIVYLAMAPASPVPSNFSSPLSLRQIGRGQIIWRLVSHFKVKQQLSSQLFHSGIFRPYPRELEIEQNYGWIGPLPPHLFTVIIIAQITLVIHLPANNLLSPKVSANYRFSIQ